MPNEDRWIISRVNSLAAQVDTEMKGCQLHRATRALTNFILEDLSRWYVQLVRPRMWEEKESVSKRQAYETIYYVMRRLIGLLAPFCPHLCEGIYQNLRCEKDPESVHMLDWFAGDPALVDAELEKAMDTVRQFDVDVANARQSGKRKLRWPVNQVIIVPSSNEVKDSIEKLKSISMNRANTKDIRITDKFDKIIWIAEPQMKTLGPKFGKNAPKVKLLIEKEDANKLKSEIESNKIVILNENLEKFEITNANVHFKPSYPDNYSKAASSIGDTYVDTDLNDNLKAEGYAREVIRRIQEMRRLLDLAVEDFITVDVMVGDPLVCILVSDNQKPVIADEVRARRLTIRTAAEPGAGTPCQLEKDWDVEGVQVRIGISRASD
jgi:isoleucyl-tRNA synthetase